MRKIVALACAGVVALSFGVASPSGAEVRTSTALSDYCSEVAPPCVVSATLNATPVPHDDPDWSVVLHSYNVGKSREIRWTIHTLDPFGNELGPDSLDDVWVVTVNTGSIVPRVVFAYGADASIVRLTSPNRVTITATPVWMTDNDECTPSWPWTCPDRATNDFEGYLDAIITNYGAWSDTAQRESMYGMNYTTNIGMTSIPPEIEFDPSTGAERLLIRLANHHEYPDGTLFEGFAHLRIPNLFLRRVYGVDDPSTLTSAGLATSGTGAAATVVVSQESGGGAMLVDITDMTFSRRRVRISRGVITPTKPKEVRARRVGGIRAKLKFTASKRRGSRITGYRATCQRGGSALSGRARTSPVVVRGLSPGVKYSCRVRALSKAGPGPWSGKARA